MPSDLKAKVSRRAYRKAHIGGRRSGLTQFAAKEPTVPTRRRWSLLLCGLLALLTLIVYGRVGSHPFIDYDDQVYVTQNEHVKAGLTWDTAAWAITSTDASNWHPLTWVSHAADVQLFGMNASGHHWTNLVLHVLNVILLFLLLERATGARWRSLFATGLFALHPLNVESVAWIAERKNVLSTTFFLLALGAYGWYARKPEWRRYAAVAVLFVLGLAAKPMVITLPFVLLLLDFWPLQRIRDWTEPSHTFPVPQNSVRQLVLEKLPLLALSAGSAAITMVAQKVSVVPGQALPFGVRLETAFYAYAMYIWKALWPMHLALIYPHPGRTLGGWKLLLGAIVVAAGSFAAWKQRADRPWVTVGWCWYLGTAVPIIGLVQVGAQVIADRYAYVPLMGLFMILAWGLIPADDAAASAGASTGLRFGAAGLILGILSCLTLRQVDVWKSSADLWMHALKVTSNNSLAEQYLANTLFGMGRYQDGMTHLRTYAAMEPMDPVAHARVGADYQDHGQLAEAAREYEASLKAVDVMTQYGLAGMDPKMLAVTYANLGVAYAQLGDSGRAAENARKAASTDSAAIVQMMREFGQFVAVRPSAAGYIRLGTLLHLFGQDAEAQEAFARANSLNAANQTAGAAQR